jgi:glutathione S-transferase
MSITFYEAPMSSATPVACALLELGVPHEKVTLNLADGDQKKPAFTKLNPNGKVPTLVVDGTPMFEALAILLWLGDRYGVEKRLWPAADAPARMQAMSWCTWSYVTYVSALVRLQYAASDHVEAQMHNDAVAEQARDELRSLLDILDARLGEAPFMLGTDYSLADLVVSSVIGYGAMTGVQVDAHPNVSRWLQTCQARPAVRSVMQG